MVMLQVSYGQSSENVYEDCLKKYLAFKLKTELIKSEDPTIFVKNGNFFSIDTVNTNIVLLSESEILEECNRQGPINLIIVSPITHEMGKLTVGIIDYDVSVQTYGKVYLLKGGGTYEIIFDCEIQKFIIKTISETI
jgi:hypothetical protein